MARRKEEGHGGGHGWFVTFADLMGLLVSFFVMLVAFSNQDLKKVQAVAGSMKEAFGVQTAARFSGVVESNSTPFRPNIENAAHVRPEESSVTPTPDEHGKDARRDRAFALAVASLRRSLEAMPELAEASKHIMFEETKRGLDINIVDQEGRAMFPEGSSTPYEHARKLIQNIARPLRGAPYRIAITGHASASGAADSEHEPWSLSVERADVVRKILEEEGYPSQNISKVAGKADTDPFVPEDPSAAPNRRVTITLIHEAPPVPPQLQP